MKLIDGLQNLAAGLGIGTRDKTAGDAFALRVCGDLELEAMYRGDWMARKIIDVPVTDMLRPWRSWQADGAKIARIEAAEKKHAVKAKVAKAMRWARLYGGSVILIGANSERPDKELATDSIKPGGLKYLTVLPRRMITAGEMETDPESPFHGQPKFYTLTSGKRAQIDIHPSRVIRVLGAERPDIDTNNEGWGDSVLQIIYDAVHHAALANSGIASLIHEAKIDVIKVPNLGASLATSDGTTALIKRFTTANSLKSINNTLLLDGAEEWERKQTSFSGLTDVQRSFLQIVAGAADIPATRLLGDSPGGLNASGDSQVRSYYDMIAGRRIDDLDPIMDRIDALILRDAGIALGRDEYYEWGSLWQMTDAEKADIAHKKAQTSKVLIDSGILNDDLFAEVIRNQLVEDGTYPGLEQAILEFRSTIAGPREGEPEDDRDPGS